MPRIRKIKNGSNGSNAEGNTITSAHITRESPAKRWVFTQSIEKFCGTHKAVVFPDISANFPIDCSNGSNISLLGNHLYNLLEKEGADEFVFQAEKGSKTGYIHFQGRISFEKKCRFKGVAGLVEKATHWEKERNYEKSIEYCKKLTDRIENTPIWSYPPLSYEIEKIEKFKPWQNEIFELLKTKPDKRSIYWYWEEDGHVGKSTFCRYLFDTMGDKIQIYDTMKKSDVFFTFSGGKKPNKKYKAPEVVIFDLPRAFLKADELDYTTMEKLKDGLIFCNKYESRGFRFNPPHIIVFANRAPSSAKMSLDRWKIQCIDEKKSEKEEKEEYTLDDILSQAT